MRNQSLVTGPPTFGIEHVPALQVLPPQLPKGPDLLAGERVRAVDAILGPPHMETAAIKLNHVPGQFAQLAGAKPMAVGEEDGGRVAVAVPGTLAGGILETVDFLRG